MRLCARTPVYVCKAVGPRAGRPSGRSQQPHTGSQLSVANGPRPADAIRQRPGHGVSVRTAPTQPVWTSALSRAGFGNPVSTELARSDTALSKLGLTQTALSKLGMAQTALSRLVLTQTVLNKLGLTQTALSRLGLTQSALSKLVLTQTALNKPGLTQ